MKKNRFIGIFIVIGIFITLFLNGCQNIKNKPEVPEKNHFISDTNILTSTPKPSPTIAPKTLEPITKKGSNSDENMKEIDYNQYIKKIWVAKNWSMDSSYIYPSFYITKIANGGIEGKFKTYGIAFPFSGNNNVTNLTGKANIDTAQCQFKEDDTENGSIKMIFKTKKEIEATTNYTKYSSGRNPSTLNGTILFRPLNLKDLEPFTPFNDQSFNIDLNDWGKVRFVSGKHPQTRHTPIAFYLTNDDGDILYDFGSPFRGDLIVKAVSFQDLNKDGLKDIIIIASWKDSPSNIASVIFQKPDGEFKIDPDLNQEINKSGKNTDVKAVEDFLSKKF